MLAVSEARNLMITMDARHIINTGLNRPLRSNANEVFRINQMAHVFQRLMKEPEGRWHSGYSVAAISGRHVIVERGVKLLKIPMHLVGGNGDE